MLAGHFLVLKGSSSSDNISSSGAREEDSSTNDSRQGGVSVPDGVKDDVKLNNIAFSSNPVQIRSSSNDSCDNISSYKGAQKRSAGNISSSNGEDREDADVSLTIKVKRILQRIYLGKAEF